VASGAEEPLTTGALRAALGEVTELMRQQQQSIQMLIQLMANQSGASPMALPAGVHPSNVELEMGASPAPTLNQDTRSAKNSEGNIPGNSVSWLHKYRSLVG